MTATYTSEIIYSRVKKILIFEASEQAPIVCFLADYWISHCPNHFNITMRGENVISVINSQVSFDFQPLLKLQLESYLLKELVSRLIDNFINFPNLDQPINFLNTPDNFILPAPKNLPAINQNVS